MKRDDAILLSIDDHLIEPPDVFERHMPARWKSKAPRLVNDGDTAGQMVDLGEKRFQKGVDRWVFQGESIGVPGLGAVCSVDRPHPRQTRLPPGGRIGRRGCRWRRRRSARQDGRD